MPSGHPIETSVFQLMMDGLKLWVDTVLVKNCVCFQVCGRRVLRMSCVTGGTGQPTYCRGFRTELSAQRPTRVGLWKGEEDKKPDSEFNACSLLWGETEERPRYEDGFPRSSVEYHSSRGVDQELSDSRACIHGEIFYSSPRHAPGNRSTWRVGTHRFSLSGGLRRAEQGQARWGGTGLRHSRPQGDLLRHPCLLTVDTTCQVGVTGFT